jgi:hypothetical protein
MTQRGATHRKALCVVGARLAERAWLTMARGQPYVICDLQGRPVTPEQGQTADRRALHRHRRGPPAALQQEGGEGPSHGARGATQVTARSRTRGDLPRASLTTPPRIVNQAVDTPASLGNQPRGGNRQLNAALHTIAVCQARDPTPAAATTCPSSARARPLAEARRALKRRLTNVIYRRIVADQHRHQPAGG